MDNFEEFCKATNISITSRLNESEVKAIAVGFAEFRVQAERIQLAERLRRKYQLPVSDWRTPAGKGFLELSGHAVKALVEELESENYKKDILMTKLNQKIFEWLGHRLNVFKIGFSRDIPDYTVDPVAMLELLQALRARGCGYMIENSGITGDIAVSIFLYQNKAFSQHYSANANTLPLALAQAVGKLIDEENKNVK